MKNILTLWVIPAVTCMLCACLDRENDSPTITSISPTTAMFHARTVFKIEGHHLPTTGDAYFRDGICEPPSNRSPSGFTLVCASSAADGQRELKVEGVPQSGIMISLSTDLPPPMAGVVLTDTGVNSDQCYKFGSDALVSCSSEEAVSLSDKQDGMIGRDVTDAAASDGTLGFSYSSVGNYSITECVLDNVTGLIWEGKPSVEGPRYFKNQYTNRRDNSADDVSTYVAAVNSSALCGYSDWRLPSREELLTLVNYSRAPKIGPSNTYYEDLSPTIDSSWFSITFHWYWTSTQVFTFWQRPEQYNEQFWVVDFDFGQVINGAAFPMTEARHSVRLVRP